MSDSTKEDECWYCGAKSEPTPENVAEKLHETDKEPELPVAAETDYCENCGCLEAVWSTGNLSKTDKKPCVNNKIQRVELVRRSDAEKAINQSVNFALQQFIAWLDDSLNGVRGEIEELKACDVEIPEDIMEQLQWKTENMMDEAEDVAEEIREDLASSKHTDTAEGGLQ